MKKIIKFISIILCLILTCSLFSFGCNGELSEKEKVTLSQRRDIVENYMRQSVDFVWRAKENITYTINSNILPEDDASNKRCDIIAGELYRGMPYTYAGGTISAFMEYQSEVDDKGIPVISGLTWDALSGSGSGPYARVGNDCSSCLCLAWSQIGNSINPKATNTKYMSVSNGFLRVGDYQSDPNSIIGTLNVCADNGKEVMVNSYAQLQKGDGLVKRNSTSGHSMMVSDIHVEYNEDGTVDANDSYVVILEQTSSNFRGSARYYDEELQENVNIFTGVDVEKSFHRLYLDGYLPITCKELIDPSSVDEPEITDSIKEYNKDSIFLGEFNSNWFMDSVYIKITDINGNELQKIAGRIIRLDQCHYDLSRFVKDNKNGFLGNIDLNELSKGKYKCITDVKLTNGQIINVRNFEFEI